MFRLATIAAVVGLAAAECPNGCSGHGKCGAFDMCTCYRNYEGNDCSLRTCPFDLAHVDTPKGDLDSSLSVVATSVVLNSQVYPKGTAEQFPIMADSAGTVLQHTAHYYMECSNKGLCNRKKGECECFEGYDGTACQRASCPNKCSGHGTCETIEELAFDDFENTYALWDKDASMGCKCDPGYSGSDCSARMCKYGIDPLYADDTSVRVQKTNFRIQSSVASTLFGTYALKFYDVFGEDYITAPIIAESAADALNTANGNNPTTCGAVEAALTGLPNDVVEKVNCASSNIGTNEGYEVSLTFVTNPGKLKQMEIVTNLDGSQASLSVRAGAVAAGAASGTLTTAVYTGGVSGAFTDYFATKCGSVQVRIAADVSGNSGTTWEATSRPGSIGYLHDSSTTALDTSIVNTIKACLGDSDGNTGNNVEVHNWDMGYVHDKTPAQGLGQAAYDYQIGSYPHAVMTVPVSQTTETTAGSDVYGLSFDAGSYHLVWWDPAAPNLKQFRVANVDANDLGSDMHLFTTDGIVQQLGVDNSTHSTNLGKDKQFSEIWFNETKVVGMFSAYTNKIYTNVDVSCENDPGTHIHACIEKGNKLFVVDSCWNDESDTPANGATGPGTVQNLFNCANSGDAAKNTGNLYTVERIYTQPYGANTTEWWRPETISSTVWKGREDRYVIVLDYNINWDGSHVGSPTDKVAYQQQGMHSGIVVLFKFSPATTGNYDYVSQCSNRGTCNGEEGLCECFSGYHGDACQKQSSLVA